MDTFKQLPLPLMLVENLSRLKFHQPTPVQREIIPLAIQGKDILTCAETGSGKTAAYCLPIAAQLINDPQATALILTPTRELAQQVADFVKQLIPNLPQLSVATLVGGMSMQPQLNALKRRPRIIVATPGRLTDHLKRKSLTLNQAQFLVLDEGDRMLDMGFAPQLDVILKYLPRKRQTLLFSATLPQKIQQLATKYMFQPKTVTVGRTSLPVQAIKQTALKLNAKDKDESLLDELIARQGSVIIFAKTKRRAQNLFRHLESYGHQVELLHGGRTQGQRNKALQRFRDGKARILCATDVAARGLDVPHVEHVINYDLPMVDDDYVHRIGRTARNGASGEALSFVTPADHRLWQNLVRKFQIKGGGGERKPSPVAPA
ncbi:MAG: DEAD/DEAH box helicase [Bdellovibrionales bacterium]|nr:DEAD/DEAH box helicase [Bdellovibrionales bacterium]